MKTKATTVKKTGTKAAARPRETGVFPFISTEEFHRIGAEWRAKFKRWPKAKQRAHLIEIGALTPEGEIPVYPMDHVPLGPRH